MVVSPDPNTQSHPGGGSVTFTFNRTISGGTGPYTTSWSTGDTGASTTFNEHAFPSEETNGNVSVTVTDSLGATASYTAEWIADGF